MGQSNGKLTKINKKNRVSRAKQSKNRYTALLSEESEASIFQKAKTRNDSSGLIDVQLNDQQASFSNYELGNQRESSQLIEKTFKISHFQQRDIPLIKQKIFAHNLKYTIVSDNIKVFGSQLSVLEFLSWLYDFLSKNISTQTVDMVRDEVSISTFQRLHKDEILDKANELSVGCDFKYDLATVSGLSLNLREFKDYLHELDRSARMSLYPKYWDFTSVNMYSEIEVSNKSEEYQEILSRMANSIPDVEIVKLMRIQNNYLMSHYITNMSMRQEVRKSDMNRQLLFHGTRAMDPSKIYTNFDTGFDIQYANELGAYGKGLYFAQNAHYSHLFSFKAEDGNLQMILADVFLGKSYEVATKKAFIKPPDGYDSVFSQKDLFFVIYNNFHSYPLYLIEYRTKCPASINKRKTKKLKKLPTSNTNQGMKPIYNNSLNPAALNRVQKELADLQADETLDFLSIKVPEEADLRRWIVDLEGPSDSYYEGGIFKIEIIFPDDYPLHSPKLTFQTQIYHPCITSNGEICLGLLACWSPTLTLKQVLLTVSALLANPSIEQPLMLDISAQYRTQRQDFIDQARLWTEKYASRS